MELNPDCPGRRPPGRKIVLSWGKAIGATVDYLRVELQPNAAQLLPGDACYLKTSLPLVGWAFLLVTHILRPSGCILV
jgi:hypothetical protein